MPSINFSSVPTMNIITPGTYAAKFDEFEEDVAGTDGSPMYKMTFVITEEGEFKGRKVFRNHSLKEAALWAFKKTCIALGADPEAFTADEEIDTDELLADLQGADCRVVLKTKKYEGEDRTDLRAILPPAFEFAS